MSDVRQGGPEAAPELPWRGRYSTVKYSTRTARYQIPRGLDGYLLLTDHLEYLAKGYLEGPETYRNLSCLLMYRLPCWAGAS